MATTMMPATPLSPPASKLLGLELLRFVAAFSVLIWHYQHFAYNADKPAEMLKSQWPLYGVLWPFYEAGEYGVWVFWCISGFIFFWKYRDQIYEGSVSGWRFFVLRFSRLYPLHVVTLLVVALLQSVHFRMQGNWFVYQENDLPHFLLQSILASGWGREQGDSFNGPIWSISVEVLVYIGFFLALRFVTRSALLNVFIIILCLNLRGQVFSCLAFFYIGGLAAIARRSLEAVKFKTAIEIVAGVISVVACLSAWQLKLSAGVFDWLFFLTITPIVLICISGDIRLPKPAERLVVAAGNMTYSSYLLHFPFQLAIAVGFASLQRRIPYEDTWFFLAFIGITLAAAYLTFRYFEMPAQKLLRAMLLRNAPIASRAGLVNTHPAT